jgi:hypothetical protein
MFNLLKQLIDARKQIDVTDHLFLIFLLFMVRRKTSFYKSTDKKSVPQFS